MLNIPNTLSVFRLCLAPLFAVCYFSGIPNSGLWSVAIYALATFTDYLDGHIARKYDMITNLGRVLDPLGDKIMTFVVLICITIDRIIPIWILIIFAVKEITMAIGGLVIHRVAKADIPPSNYIGKTATVLFFIACAVLVLFPKIPRSAAIAMMCVVLAVAVAAFISYAMNYARIMKNRDL